MRVVIAEDSALLRAGLSRLLEDAGHEVVGHAGDGDDLVRIVRGHRPDLAVVDIRMPPTHTTEGLDAARRIRAEHPGIAILILSQHIETGEVVDLVRDGGGGFGYMLKDRVRDVDTLMEAAERVALGGTALDREVVEALVGGAQGSDPIDDLSGRELEVLALMAEGRSNAGIAEQLVLTDRTVQTHVRHILGKLGIVGNANSHRRVLAVIAYLRQRQH